MEECKKISCHGVSLALKETLSWLLRMHSSLGMLNRFSFSAVPSSPDTSASLAPPPQPAQRVPPFCPGSLAAPQPGMNPGQGPSWAQSPRPRISLWVAAGELFYLLISDMLRAVVVGCCSHSAPTQAPCLNLSLLCPQVAPQPTPLLHDKEGCSPIGWNPPQRV